MTWSIRMVALAAGLMSFAASAQVSPLPDKTAINHCSSPTQCVRYMFPTNQLSRSFQAALGRIVGQLPQTEDGSMSCSYHGSGVGTTLVCLHVSAKGSCAIVSTQTGTHSIGDHPGCPNNVPQ